MKRYSLAIDHDFCWGCRTCEVACKQELNPPDGVRLISVIEDGPKRVDGRLDFSYRVSLCQHCDNPPCAHACPEEAISKRPDGIVVTHYELCTGCGSCIEACDYSAISIHGESGLAWKCNLCHERIDNGLLPACADNVCLAHCIHFVDSEE